MPTAKKSSFSDFKLLGGKGGNSLIFDTSDNNGDESDLRLCDIDEVPDDLDRFYSQVGQFVNRKTNEYVREFSDYQHEAWADRKKSKYRLYLKSQKIGLSTLFLLEDLHIALTRGRGNEILIISQSLAKAKDHLQDLKKMIIDSPRYGDFLIDRPETSEDLLRDERTKIDTIYLRNPERPRETTKIIALGITSPGSLISFKKVCHIHMSDITLADMTSERMYESFGGAFSRLANTDGSIVIECPPRGPHGPVFDIVDGDTSLKQDGVTVDIEEGRQILTNQGFLVRRYTYQVGVSAGMITEEFIGKERHRLGVLFEMYYGASFYSSNTTWFKKEHIYQVSDEATAAYDSD